MRMPSKHIATLMFCCLLMLNRAVHGQWVQQAFQSKERLNKVRFANTNVGWILGEQAIYKTENAGQTWARSDSTAGFGDLLLVLDEQTAFYASAKNFGTPFTSGLRRTVDGGATWHVADNRYFYYFDIAFVNDRIGYVAAANEEFRAAILKTTNGGATWQTLADDFSPAKLEVSGISFIDEQRGWAVSYDAFIFNTTDGGETWALQDSIRPVPHFTVPLRKVHFASADSGWAVGGLSGTSLIVRTTDGGQTWNAMTQNGCSFRDMAFVNRRQGWIAGTAFAPNIYHTNDGGQSWTPQTLLPEPLRAPSIWSLAVLDETHGWAVGDSGRVYRLEFAVRVTEGEASMPPAQFKLHSAYPNPFRETTRIVYELPQPERIRVAVYDVLGREVALLFEGEKAAGVFHVTWNGRDRNGRALPSGVYFFRLAANHIQITRKLVLVH